MTVCPVFSTYLCASRVDVEIDALVEDFEGQISSGKDKRFSVTEGEWHKADDGNFAGYRYATRRSVLTIGGSRGKPRLRSLSLHFDLVRDLTPSGWPHAREALLVMAFASERGEWWEPESLCVAGSGRLEDSETWERFRASASVDKKFLVWQESEATSDYSKIDVSGQDWIFAVPVQLINDSDAVRNMLVNPVCSLLTGRHPQEALSGSPAIEWNVGS